MILETRQLRIEREGKAVLRGVDFSAGGGELIGIVGPNGAGKSTLLRALAGLLPPTSGSVLLDGTPLATFSRKEIAKRIAVLPQDTPADLPFTAMEVVLMGRSPHLGRLGLDGPIDREIAEGALETVGAADLAARPFSQLSGGERQRVLLARTLAQKAPIWLWDEPTSHLDLAHQQLALRLAKAHAKEGNVVVVVLHDLVQASQVCDSVAILHEGALVSAGPAKEVLTPAALERTFALPFTYAASGADPSGTLVPKWDLR